MFLRRHAMFVVLFLVILGQAPDPMAQTPSRAAERKAMVSKYLKARGIDDERVLQAMRDVPRHRFVPEEFRSLAYADRALPIGLDQTISQPYIVGFMTQALELEPQHRVFELGTGSGYQAAVASRIVDAVYSVEIVPQLAARATALLDDLGYDNIHVRVGDGWAGWPEAAPFDRILVTAAAPELPQPLLDQLKPGGMMIMPVGEDEDVQELMLVEKNAEGAIKSRPLLPVRFVPVTGDH